MTMGSDGSGGDEQQRAGQREEAADVGEDAPLRRRWEDDHAAELAFDLDWGGHHRTGRRLSGNRIERGARDCGGDLPSNLLA